MEKKKTKLTISGSPKKSLNVKNKNNQGKKTVFIDRKTTKNFNKPSFNKSSGYKSSSGNFKKNPNFKVKIAPKFNPSAISDFEKRKLAEQRATKKFKGDLDKDKKNKIGEKKMLN